MLQVSSPGVPGWCVSGWTLPLLDLPVSLTVMMRLHPPPSVCLPWCLALSTALELTQQYGVHSLREVWLGRRRELATLGRMVGLHLRPGILRLFFFLSLLNTGSREFWAFLGRNQVFILCCQLMEANASPLFSLVAGRASLLARHLKFKPEPLYLPARHLPPC